MKSKIHIFSCLLTSLIWLVFFVILWGTTSMNESQISYDVVVCLGVWIIYFLLFFITAVVYRIVKKSNLLLVSLFYSFVIFIVGLGIAILESEIVSYRLRNFGEWPGFIKKLF